VANYTRQYPLSAREEFQYDAARNEAIFTETASFLEISKGGCKSAPLPPIAALAMKQGSFVKLKTSSPLEPVRFSTPLGPLLRSENTETFTWSVQGLRELVEPPAVQEDRGKAPANLVAEFHARVDKMLAVGVLAPWAYADNVPINASRGEYYWGEPGEILALLAPLHGVLDEKRQAGLVRYMAEVRRTWPPEKTAWIPPDEGTRRGGYELGPCQLAERVAQERSRRVSPYALYGIERFYAVTGSKPDAQTWQACQELLSAAFEEQAWATLYLLGHPNRVLPWKKRSGIDPARLAEWDESPDWRGDRPGAAVNANRLFAAGVGAVRLARLMNDPAAEQKAWWLLARAAVLRLAMGKYAAWQYKAGLVTIPPEGDWYWKYSQHFPRSWGGYLETDDWSRPEHDVRQVVDLAPDGVELQDWAGTVGDAWTQRTTAELVAFRYMTPELARLLDDHLRSEAAALIERIAWNQPLWYASFGEAILGWEHNMNHPSDAYQVFMARSRLLSPSPEQLTRWVDVPWLDRGDLFYLNKLAEAIRTYRSGKGN
jgi:hypothetical protein